MTFSHRIFQFLKALTAILFCGFFPVQLLAVDATLSIDENHAGVIATDISGNGQVAIGYSTQNSIVHFDLSTATIISTSIPNTLFSTQPAHAYGISDDGNAIVGWVKENDSSSTRKKAFYLSDLSGAMQNLDIGDYYGSVAYGISGDGSVVVGQSNNSAAFRWRRDNPVMQKFTMPSGLSYSSAHGVSSDGKSIVGHARSDSFSGANKVFLWREHPTNSTTGTMHIIENTLDGTAKPAGAYAISGDGKTIVGYSGSYSDKEAFRLVLTNPADPNSGSMQNLGNFHTLNDVGESHAYDVNYNGSVIVGTTYYGTQAGTNAPIAFRWESGTLQKLTDWITSLGGNTAGLYFPEAIAVSNDGNTIIAKPQQPPIDLGTNSLKSENYHPRTNQEDTYIIRYIPTSTIVSPPPVDPVDPPPVDPVDPPPVDPVDPPPTTITNPAPNAGQAAAISMSASREASFFIASGLLYALANDAFDGFFLPPFCDDEDENNKRHASIHLLGQLDKEKEDCFNASRHSNGAYQLSFNHQSSQGLSYGLGFNVGKTQHQLANLAFNSSANRPEFSAHIRTPILPNTYLTLSANQHDRAYQIHRHSIKGVENAHGSLSAQGQTYNALLTHPFSIGDIRFSPMLGLSYQQLNISAYDERTSRAVFPFHLSAGHNNVMRAQAGIQAKVALSQLTKLSLKFNALQDIHRDISPINASAGGFTMLSNFDPNAVLDDQDYATALNLNFTHRVDQHHRLGFNVELKNPFYQQGNEFQVSLEQVIEF